MVAEVDGDTADTAEGLEDLFCAVFDETVAEVEGDRLGDDRVPAFIIDGDALFEAAEEEVAFVEVPEEYFIYFVFFF